MSVFESSTEPRLGALNINPPIPLPHLPNIVFEWLAIIPLVVHLASQRDDYITVGEIALLGRLSIGFSPKLGFFNSLDKLLNRGSDFIDQSSSQGGASRRVWDVKWGSVFPCANAAASSLIIDQVLRSSKSADIEIPSYRPPKEGHRDSLNSPPSSDDKAAGNANQVIQPRFLRYQNLHTLHFERTSSKGHSWTRFGLSTDNTAFRVVFIVVNFIFSGVFIACGTYGTAACTLISTISQVMNLRSLVGRPPGYMMNSEGHDACMLMANHENSMDWYLLTGDRAVIDSLLNKPMLQILGTHYAATTWFRASNYLQIAAMTFAAGQKGWDGVFLAALILIENIVRYTFRGRALVHDFLARERIRIRKKTFKFTGRVAMLGAIQLFSKSRITCWMDSILVPHPRRTGFLQSLGLIDCTAKVVLSPSDQEWIEMNVSFARAATAIMKAELLTERV